MQQRILQRSVMVTRCRVNHEALGLIDHNEGFILIDDVERDGFRGHVRDDFKQRNEDDFFPAEEFSLGFRGLSIDGHGAGLDPILNPVSGIFGKQPA